MKTSRLPATLVLGAFAIAAGLLVTIQAQAAKILDSRPPPQFTQTSPEAWFNSSPLTRDVFKGKVTKIYWSWDRDAHRVRWDRIGRARLALAGGGTPGRLYATQAASMLLLALAQLLVVEPDDLLELVLGEVGVGKR